MNLDFLRRRLGYPDLKDVEDHAVETVRLANIQRRAGIALPEANSIWVHTSGTLYQVLMLTNVHATDPRYPVTVVYQTCDQTLPVVKRGPWSRPLIHWHETMTAKPIDPGNLMHIRV